MLIDCHPRLGVDFFVVIVFHRQAVKILFFQNRPDIGLIVEDLNLHLLKAAAFPAVRIAGILALRTVVLHFQILLRIAAPLQIQASLLAEQRRILFQAAGLFGIAFQHPAPCLGHDSCNLICQGLHLGNPFIHFTKPFLLPLPVQYLPAAVDAHNGIILRITESHPLLLLSPAVCACPPRHIFHNRRNARRNS